MAAPNRTVARVIKALAEATTETPRAQLERAFARIPRDERFTIERRARRNTTLGWTKTFESSQSLFAERLTRKLSPEREAARELWDSLARELRAIHGKPTLKQKNLMRWQVSAKAVLGCTLSGTSVGISGPVTDHVSVFWEFR